MKLLFLGILFFSTSPLLTFASEDLLDIYDMALTADPELKQALLSYEIVLESKQQAFSKLLPNISINGDRTVNSQKRSFDVSQFNGEETYRSYGYSLSINQPLFRYENNVEFQQSRDRIHKASADLMSAKQALIIKLAERYFNILTAKNNMRFIAAEKIAVKRQLVQAENRLKAGLATVTDVYEAQAQLDATNADAIKAKYQYTNSLESLREITGRNHDRLKSVSELSLLSQPSLFGKKKWEKLALNNNWKIVSLMRDNRILLQDIKSSKTKYFPTLDLVARYAKSTSGGGNFGRSNTESRIASIQLTVPVYQGGYTTSKVREAVLKRELNIEKLDALRRSVRTKIHKNYTGVISSIATAKSLLQSVASSEKALNAIVAGNIAGIRTTGDILLATKKLYLAQRDYKRSRYDYILNTLRLRETAGMLTIADLSKVNAWLN